jgi:hypothetical protein
MATQLGVLGKHQHFCRRHLLIREYSVGLAADSISYRTLLCHALVELDRYSLHCSLYTALLCCETPTPARIEAVNHRAHDWELALVYLYFDAFYPTDHAPFTVLSGSRNGYRLISHHARVGQYRVPASVSTDPKCQTSLESLSPRQHDHRLLHRHRDPHSPRHWDNIAS